MNGNSRHTHHNNYRRHQPRPSQRRRVRRRHQLSAILAVVGITLLLLATVFLIIGARMHKKSAALRELTTESEQEILAPATPQTPKVISYPLNRTSPSASLSALVKAEKSAASLHLSDSTSTSTVKSLAETADKQGIYLSGVYSLSSLAKTDDLTRHELLSSDCVLLAEALRAGLDEVVLLLPELSSDRVDELKAFLADLRRLVPDATVGISLPRELLSEENAPLLDDLSKHFSLLAVDFSDSEQLDADLETHLYLLLRYSMRVLISASEEETQEALISSITSHSIQNIQFLP